MQLVFVEDCSLLVSSVNEPSFLPVLMAIVAQRTASGCALTGLTSDSGLRHTQLTSLITTSTQMKTLRSLLVCFFDVFWCVF